VSSTRWFRVTALAEAVSYLVRIDRSPDGTALGRQG
jgi:hypothetical protein